ncbi:GtrA family protein [Luteibacter sp. CQ10]|uniref:GtrA family protein n=1 Tax=Luteibacter sp. CQ10 TaxID=2805821 RepID=UPI0034A36F86
MIRRIFRTHRQMVLYVTFGLTQLLIDWAGFLVLTHLGLSIAAANPSSRLFAAIVGYVLNATLTFRTSPEDRHVNLASFLRYATLWVATTAISTALISGAALLLGKEALPVVKILIEGAMAVVSFLTMKFWVYRRSHEGHESAR